MSIHKLTIFKKGVIPAKAGIQFFQLFKNFLDSGSCRRTGVTTFYGFIIIPLFHHSFKFEQRLWTKK
jgi:hypothetical protein